MTGSVMAVGGQSGRLSDRDRTAARRWLDGVDRAAWQRFFLALLGLTLALFLALYATGLSQTGQYRLAAVVAAVSLLITAVVAVRVVPGLARRTALQYWMAKVKYEFTPEGAVYLAMIAVITVAALNTGNNLLFIILSCMLAGILASGVLSRIVLEGLELDLSLPDHIFAEQAVLARLRLVNRKRFFSTFSVTISGRANFRHRRTSRPAALTPTILNQDVYISFLPRRSSTNPNVMLKFPKRGNYSQDSFRVSTRFPFGFIRKTRSIHCGRALLVLPSVQPTKKFFEILPQLGGRLDSYLKGHSHDLYSLRDYQQSDSARHVDWKATARVGQLKVREFTRDDERRLRLVFDPWVPNSHPETLESFEKAVTLCACLAWYYYETGSTISFATKGFETPMSPADQLLYPILERLALIEPAPAPASSLDHLLSDSKTQTECFKVIVTHQAPIPSGRWNSAYFVFMDSQ
jgi:uncharacterized protein (DUF58 family)